MYLLLEVKLKLMTCLGVIRDRMAFKRLMGLLSANL